MTDMIRVDLNGRWTLYLPKHRKDAGWSNPDGWEHARLDSMAMNLGSGDLVFDAGAEQGDMPALYALWGCDVMLIEPQRLVWPNIRAIFEANNLRDRVVGTFVGFVGDATVTARNDEPLAVSPYVWPSCAHGKILVENSFCQLNERPDISRIRIDDLVEELGKAPNAITIDTEGSEYEVLLGAERTMLTFRPLVWCSVHPVFIREQYGHSYADVLALVERYGYKYELLDLRHEQHYLFYPSECEYDEGYVDR